LKAYQHGNSWFGRTRCSFHAGVGQFYVTYLLAAAGLVAAGILLAVSGVGSGLAALLQAQKHGGHVNPYLMLRALAVIYGVLILLAISIGPAFHALITNLIWSNTRVGEHRIECRMSPLVLIGITLSNLLAVVLTLGLFSPWALVRVARYQLESMRLVPATDLQEFVDAEPETIGAVGEEAATAFDFDIAL